MKKLLCMMLVLCFVLASCATTGNESKTSESASKNESTSSVSDIVKSEYRISESDLYDKVLGSWLGQAAGVVWGAKTEFAYQWKTIPEEGVPDISTLNLNDAYGQDDLYVEIPYMDAMKKYGVDCSLDLVAQEFAKTKFPLDHANKIGRLNLQKGIKAPESGSYKYNNHCDDIDWQIEADFLGSIYPALVNEGAARAFELGHITNYGDGVYGGVFVVAMHAAAFYAKNVDEIIDAGISVIPKGTKFREMMDDVVTWKSEGLTWEENWQKLFDKWEKTKRCHWYAGGSANIDAKMNSAYILMGLLYGEGDFDKSMKISMQCGQDSDCNPSSVGAVLGTFIGYKKIDSKWKTIDPNGSKFTYTEYTFEQVAKLNNELAVKMFEKLGFSKDGDKWVIKYNPEYVAVPFEQWPDMPTAEYAITCDGSDIVRMSITARDIKGIKSIEWDMGDGSVYKNNVTAHQYKKIGEYTIKCKVTNLNDASIFHEEKVKITSIAPVIDDPNKGSYRNIAKNGVIICTVYQPTGGGSKDLEIIRDGVKSGGNTEQYDTYAGYLGRHEDHIGYMFRSEYAVDKVEFTEGMHYGNGGWFIGETFRVEALIGGEWKKIDSVSTPAYPTGNAMNDYGASYETYTFTFDSVNCTGIRVIGDVGGDAGFAGTSELEVYGKEAG